MIADDGIDAVAGLAEASTREAAARRLATFVGAEALVVLIHDVSLGGLVPAPGFPKTLPGGALWHTFLAAAARAARHDGTVGHPAPATPAPATSCRVGPALFVFVGGSCNDARLDGVRPALPLAAGLLAAEQDALAARGELRAAQDHARQVETLVKALDAARAEGARSMAEVNRYTQELIEARRHAEAAARAKDEFLAMLGHELRNPLAPIATALQLLRLKQIHAREHDVIERQVGSLMQLIDDLLDVSRITRGRVELRREVVELSAVAARAIEIASPELERKRQHLEVAVPPSACPVDGDPTRLTQVLTNLLTNASKYSDPERSIRLSAEPHGDRVRIAVQDHGIGLPPEMVTRVFELFVQAPQALDRAQGGLGLGLAIVRSLVELHGGRAWAESPGPGRGSTFFVELPLSPVPAPGNVTAAPPLAVAPIPPPRDTRVLIVDDNEDARTTLSEALVKFGYVVMSAPDGPTALMIAADFMPDVAILDIGLPVMDGYELAGHLKGESGVQRLIAVTGYGQQSDRARAEKAGFDAHFVKPIALDELARVLDATVSPRAR